MGRGTLVVQSIVTFMVCGSLSGDAQLKLLSSLQKDDGNKEYKMYVLARHVGESIIIADVIEIKVLSVTGKIARLGIIAPREVPVKRAELLVEVTGEANAEED